MFRQAGKLPYKNIVLNDSQVLTRFSQKPESYITKNGKMNTRD